MKKLNKKFMLLVIAGALTIGTATSPVLADSSTAKVGVVEDNGRGVRKPIVSKNTVTLKINGSLRSINCKSGTYQEVFDYIKNQGYTDFTVKNYWGTQVFSWYNFDSQKICEVFF